MHFYEFVANSAWKYNCLPTSKHRQAKVRRFLGICCYDCFIYRSNFAFQKCIETRHHLGCGRKTVNSQGYSELREPIKTRENCYSLIWWILKSNTCHRTNTCLSHFFFPLAGSFYLKELCLIVARASGTVLSSRATPKVMFGRISLHSLSFIYSYLAVAMTIALAVICVAILLAVILIIILYRRNRKEKERLEHKNEWVYATVLSLTYQNR